MFKDNIDAIDSQNNILIKGARQHNLKNIDVVIPRNTLTVITGVSGSGKSTLAFDTLYAEGQRRYVESLSSYARQFLARLEKPEVDYIKGISPAIAIEQKVVSKNSRSTVGSTTEVYDYLKILFARLGKIISPKTGKEVKRESTDEIVSSLFEFKGTKGVVYVASDKLTGKKIKDLIAEGYSRAQLKGEFVLLEELSDKDQGKFDLVLDRFMIKADDGFISDLKDSIEEAYLFSDGYCWIDLHFDDKVKTFSFSNHMEEEGMVFEEPNVNLFNHNSPLGACSTCEGFGQTLGISEDLVISNSGLSVYEGAVQPWKTPSQTKWKYNFIKSCEAYDFPIHKPYKDLTKEQKNLLWNGGKGVKGIHAFFDHKQKKIYKIQNRVLISRYKGRTLCPECGGQRLRKEALCVKVGELNIADVTSLTIEKALEWIQSLKFNERESIVANRVIDEITSRLKFLVEVGVPYISLDRPSNTLSGGESQRINLASSLGSSLVGALYVLDEPSIGLHPKDTVKLIGVLKRLNALGNTVVIVEHDEDIIRSAAYLIDIGPKAGSLGGEVVYQGTVPKMLKADTLTANYLNKKLVVNSKSKGSSSGKKITLKNARKNNLNIPVFSLPINALSVITGRSGSGKSTLLLEELVPAMKEYLAGGIPDQLKGDYRLIDHLEYVDQNPIGRSSRSNPATYIKVYDDIRTLFSNQPLSKLKGFKPGFFSLNVPGGRCENCQGEGHVSVEMQFMADLKIKCTACEGKKFKDEILEVEYKGKSISDVLNLTVDEAVQLFESGVTSKKGNPEAKIFAKLKPLQDVGLNYIKLGQSSSTLSGGEAQRVKLAFFLVKGNSQKNTLFIFDEPTTGLHFHDVNQLLTSFDFLIEQGHTIVVIEHNMDVARCADYLVELGPEGGNKGGELCFAGSPNEFFK